MIISNKYFIIKETICKLFSDLFAENKNDQWWFDLEQEELPAQSLYSPIILRLLRYDLKNQTDYVKTLQSYLNNNMHAVQTAKDLFIHRATIVYRLERIKEIGETDLKNADDLFHFSLTFKLIGLGLS